MISHYLNVSALIVAIISILLTLGVNLKLESVKKKFELQLHKDLNTYQNLWKLWKKYHKVYTYVMMSEDMGNENADDNIEKTKEMLEEFRAFGAKNEPIISEKLYRYFQVFIGEVESKESIEIMDKNNLINLHRKIVDEYRRLMR